MQKERGEIILRPRPGKRIRSGVSAPGADNATFTEFNGGEEIERKEAMILGKPSTSVMEDSDDDLEIEPPRDGFQVTG